MKILVINSGSSSVKFKLFDNYDLVIKGIIEAISLPNSKLTYSIDYSKIKLNRSNKKNIMSSLNNVKPIIKKQVRQFFKDHNEALNKIINLLVEESILTNINEIDAIGHRVVHGGEEFTKPTLINEKVINTIKKLSKLAPLHNPPNLKGIEAISKILPNKPQVAVFDTGFHSTMPKYAYLYPIPYELYNKEGIRRYGFHGISHEYVCKKAAEILKKPLEKINLISCHLGNGSSITAIKNGQSIDTSMGFTPLEGLMMGTRCGDIDPAIVTYLIKMGKSVEEVENMLNKKSGLSAISQISSDMRVIHEKSKQGDKNSMLAIEMFAYRVKKYIGSYFAVLNKVDAIIFTAGIGENAYYIRKKILENMSYLNIKIDDEKNANNELIISKNGSIPVLVIPTDEEYAILQKTSEIILNKV